MSTTDIFHDTETRFTWNTDANTKQGSLKIKIELCFCHTFIFYIHQSGSKDKLIKEKRETKVEEYKEKKGKKR